jgi:hypothetical protein
MAILQLHSNAYGLKIFSKPRVTIMTIKVLNYSDILLTMC